MDEETGTKRQLIEAYLSLHMFHDVQRRDNINLHFCMNSAGRRYDLAVERQWINLSSNKTIAERLENLQVVPFLLENRAAWIGATATEREVITHVQPDAKS